MKTLAESIRAGDKITSMRRHNRMEVLLKSTFFLSLQIIVLSGALSAQQDGDSKAATGGARPAQMNEGFIGRDVPHFDPGSDTVAYDGKIANLNDNRIFRARFEKYLAAAPPTEAADIEYRKTLDWIMSLLAPGQVNRQTFDSAFFLLKKASQYKDDANLCISLSDAIFSAQSNFALIEYLRQQNERLRFHVSQAEWNLLMSAQSGLAAPLPSMPPKPSIEQIRAFNDAMIARMRGATRAYSEAGQTIQNNKLRMAALELSAKGQMQSLIVQFFVTRRFQHTIIANRFYRAICINGDSNSLEAYKKMVDALPTNKDAGQAKLTAEFNPQVKAESMWGVGSTNSLGPAPTPAFAPAPTPAPPPVQTQSFEAKGVRMGVENLSVESLVGGAADAAQAVCKLISSLSQIDALANEAIRDINEGVDAYKFLLGKGEMKSATERLAETFAMGEFMPSVRLLSRDDKRQALHFTQKSNQLLACLEVNDLSGAEKLVAEMQALYSDFDASKPLAKIETAKAMSQMHLAKARNAASSGNATNMEAELMEAGHIWPRNPALAAVGGKLLIQSGVQQKAASDFDQLVRQKNFRQIYEDRNRYMVAVILFPEKQVQLQKILEDMAQIEGVILRAQETEKRGDPIGAWEGVEIAAKKFPADNKLNQIRAELTTKASLFVYTYKQGEEKENTSQFGSALALYLTALKLYPPSDLAKNGVQRICQQFLPDAQ